MAGQKWTEAEIQQLIALYPDTPTEELMQVFGRSYRAIALQAKFHGVKKSQNYLETYGGRIKKGNTPANKGQKGLQVAWNKGMKGLQMGGKETQFKQGRLPHNTKSDGYISIRTHNRGEKYKWVRVGIKEWKQLHRVIWEEHHGTIPEGYVVIFKDNNTLNCDINNLEMITRQENMKRNSFLNYPPEVRENVRLTNKIFKLINNQSDGT